MLNRPETRDAGIVGRIVRVTKLLGPGQGQTRKEWAYWEFEEAPWTVPQGRYRGMQIDYLADEALRPIGNPGEDEVDETLLRNPVPREVVT